MNKVRLGVSACLLGQPVRYDGSHKLDTILADILGPFADYVPVCPEVECGLPVPREPMHLEGSIASPRLVVTRTRLDLTEKILSWTGRHLKQLERENLWGFIFKSNSPSCGIERVRISSPEGSSGDAGAGIFAAEFMKRFPTVPVEDERGLRDRGAWETFMERVFIFSRWRELLASGGDLAALIDFHSRHKLIFMAHSPKHYRLLGRLVGTGGEISPKKLFHEYFTFMAEALSLRATPSKNANVLQHLAGYFKKVLSHEEKSELQELISQYHAGRIPLPIPIALINHYVRKYDQPYLRSQYYLNPHPVELRLRNHARHSASQPSE
ncbi:MAG: DUF523 and DUF1722 domain-containing protein [Desulfobacteraceae bacterium]|nr:DUF523 and DUF1722 domain-containing protein [Desulfobacteraceae bacterium]